MQVPHASTVTMLRDPTPVTRSVNTVDWTADGSKLATSFAIMNFQEQPHNMSLDSYIWDVHNPNDPEFTMSPLSQVVCSKFNLKDNNIIGAGLYNGQFSVFDMRKVRAPPLAATMLSLLHSIPVPYLRLPLSPFLCVNFGWSPRKISIC